MNESKKSINIIYLASIIFYLVVGVLVLVFSSDNIEKNNSLLSIFIVLGSVPHLLIFIMEGSFKNIRAIPYFVIALAAYVMGAIFLIFKEIDIDTICLSWGILDITRGAVEIALTIKEVRHDKLELIEIAISLGDIVVGALLCAHLSHGIKLHLIYFGIAFLISAINRVVKIIIETKHNESEGSNSN